MSGIGFYELLRVSTLLPAEAVYINPFFVFVSTSSQVLRKRVYSSAYHSAKDKAMAAGDDSEIGKAFLRTQVCKL